MCVVEKLLLLLFLKRGTAQFFPKVLFFPCLYSFTRKNYFESDSDPTGVKNLFNEDFQKRLGDTVGNSINSIENSVNGKE